MDINLDINSFLEKRAYLFFLFIEIFKDSPKAFGTAYLGGLLQCREGISSDGKN